MHTFIHNYPAIIDVVLVLAVIGTFTLGVITVKGITRGGF